MRSGCSTVSTTCSCWIRATALEVFLDALDVDQGRLAILVEHGDRAADQPAVAVVLEPVQSEARGASAVQARYRDDDDLVGHP